MSNSAVPPEGVTTPTADDDSIGTDAGEDRDQPPGFPGYDTSWLPPAGEAAERVLAFVSWFGDGEIYGWTAPDPADTHPSLFARDLEAVAKAAGVVPPAAQTPERPGEASD